MRPEYTPADIARFWSKVDTSGDCWVWIASKSKSGYGKFWAQGHDNRAHRASWEIHNGPIPDGLFVCHHCDNTVCVRPDHLFLGTARDNTHDMLAKGRGPQVPHFVLHPEYRPRGDRHWTRQHPEAMARGDEHWSHRQPERLARGERAGLAKLTDVTVVEIRRIYAAGGITQIQLGQLFGVSEPTIYRIIHRRSWKHVA